MFKRRMPSNLQILPDRENPVSVPRHHFVNGSPLVGPYPEEMEQIVLGMGCFWGAERKFWLLNGVFSTSVGYSGGTTRNPSYEDVCSGRTGHTEVVKVVWDPRGCRIQRDLAYFLGGTRSNPGNETRK